MSSSRSSSHANAETAITQGSPPTKEFRESVRAHAITLAAALALSERVRGRAELYRVANGTNARNDYDFEADIIDAVVVLAASKNYNLRGDRNIPGTENRQRTFPEMIPSFGATAEVSDEQTTNPDPVIERASEADDMLASTQDRRRRRLMGS
jgi:hypothetical protein